MMWHVGMQVGCTASVGDAERPICIPTRSVGTSKNEQKIWMKLFKHEQSGAVAFDEIPVVTDT